MRVLISTNHGQGLRENDFCHTDDGELVAMTGFECDGVDIDGSCGCRRSFSGLTSHKATTTCMVIDSEEDVDTLAREIYDSYAAGGWLKLCTPEEHEEWQHTALEKANEIVYIAGQFEERSVLEKRGDKICRRGVVRNLNKLVKGTDNGARAQSGKKRRTSSAKSANPRRKGKAGARPKTNRKGKRAKS